MMMSILILMGIVVVSGAINIGIIGERSIMASIWLGVALAYGYIIYITARWR